jgi:dinuclear metal center YbgI/SA1388 family protein
MVKVLDIIGTCDRILQAESFADYGPNGLQVPGRVETDLIVTGVSATRALIERAVELGAGLVITHHGLFWKGQVGLTPTLAERLRPLFRHDIALAAYHLPLDAHPEIGNNAILAERLGCDSHEPFGDLGRTAIFGGEGVPVEELLARVETVTSRAPLHQGAGPARVKRLAIVSGAAADLVDEATGCDAFLTGEPKERVMAEAEEAGIHFFAAGHYATETFGINRLGELLSAEHGVEHRFVDLPNPV